MTRKSADLLLTPEQVAEQLGLHVRTVRRYIREGELEAVRVGKRYRVTPAALERFTGVALAAHGPEAGSRRAPTDVASIVQVDDLDQDAAERLTTLLMASAQGRRPAQSPLHLETVYSPERRRLKVVCNGEITATTALLALVNTLLQDLR